MNNITKKQHYVPQMYLRNFSKDERCYVYNPYTSEIGLSNIKDLCEENYLYEIRNKEGRFLFPDKKNEFENALSVIEGKDAALLKNILHRVIGGNDYIQIDKDERESLLGFILLMLLRNPVIREVLPEVLEETLGKEIKTKEEVSVAWLFTIANIDKIAPDINKAGIIFLEAPRNYPFITTSLPVSFNSLSLTDHFYMPISSIVAVELFDPKYKVVDLNTCRKKRLTAEEVEGCNCKLLSRDSFIICESEEVLKKHVSFMDAFDKCPINPYVAENIRMISNLPREHLLRLIVKYVDLEIDNNNHVFVNTYQRLRELGAEEKKVKLKMAYAIEEEFKKGIFNNKRPDDKRCQMILERMKLLF